MQNLPKSSNLARHLKSASTNFTNRTISVVDIFCGSGGLTHGLLSAGLNVVAGVDQDELCRFPIEYNNPGVRFYHRNATSLCGTELLSWYPKNATKVLAGCAPCQPFSKYSGTTKRDGRWQLLIEFGRLVDAIKPEVVVMENVPMLRHHSAYSTFLKCLSSLGYSIEADILRCSDYAVPQTRQRLVLIASRGETCIKLPRAVEQHSLSVRQAIGDLGSATPGIGTNKNDPLHIYSRLSPLNLQRIRATPEGGSWRDWPEQLRLDCHRKQSGKYYGSVYGRMRWDSLAPTITTQCFGYGNGRFGHPSEDRAITLREAARLQTFPSTYKFIEPGTRGTFQSLGRLIGNAVPVKLAHAIGQAILEAYIPKVQPTSQRIEKQDYGHRGSTTQNSSAM